MYLYHQKRRANLIMNRIQRAEYLNKYSANTINKLLDAYDKNLLTPNDLIQAIKYTEQNNKNEPYVDDFLGSIENDIFHKTAVGIFSSTLYEHCSYKEAVEYVKSGAFYPTEYASLSVTNEVAEQLDKMGIPLRACESFNYCYDIDCADRLKGTLERGAAIFVQDKKLAVKVCEYMKMPDWSNFRSQVELAMGVEIASLSGDMLSGLRNKYLHENRCIALSQAVSNNNYNLCLEVHQNFVKKTLTWSEWSNGYINKYNNKGDRLIVDTTVPIVLVD